MGRTRGILFAFVAIAALCSVSLLYGESRAPEWYVDSVIHTHHSAGVQGPEWEEQFDAVRPDAVQFHVLPGRAGWPAKSEVTIPEEGIIRMKELAAKYDVATVFTVSRSGQWRDIASLVEVLSEEEQATFFKRVNPDGSSAGRYHLEHVCYYSPGLDRHIIPTYRKIIDQYRPRQIWIDHTIVTVNLCYCSLCQKNFRETFEVDPPQVAGDSHWDEWVAYHRAGFEAWMKKVHALDPDGTLMTFNHAYFIVQPEPPPAYVRNLSADIHSEPLEMSLFARYASTLDVPFDLMPGLTDRWAGKVPKTEDEVVQTAAVITANGGRWNIGEFPMSRGTQPVDEMLALAAAGTRMVREREAWSHRTKPVPLVAILQTASTQYRRVIPRGENERIEGGDPARTRIYWHDNRSIPLEVRGAGTALLENNIPFDIINEVTLKERLGEYSLLIVGDQFHLDPKTVESIRRFVEGGGALLATGRTVESELSRVLGVRLISDAVVEDPHLAFGEARISLEGALLVRAAEAEVIRTYAGNVQSAAIVRRDLGEGRILYVAGDFFSTYLEVSPYTKWAESSEGNREMREAVSGWIRELAPELGFACSAPPWVEVALRRKEESILVHLVERTFEWGSEHASGFDGPIELSLVRESRPGDVWLQPGNRKIEWSWSDGTVHARVAVAELKTHAILEITGE